MTEKRICKAESKVEKKREEAKSQSGNTPKRFKTDSDNHLFRGKAYTYFVNLSMVELPEQPTIF